MPPEQELLSRTLEEAKAWLQPQLASGAVELAIVGDFDVEAAIAAVAQTVGALPPRGPKPELPELKKVSFPEPPFTKNYEIASEIPKGALLLYWPSDDGIAAPRHRRLNLLGMILNDRLRAKVREELGTSYSPRAGSNASTLFPGYGYFSAAIDIEPSAAANVAELVIGIADDLARNGVTADELERARLPLLTSLRDSLRMNGYWLTTVLARAQEQPEVLDWARTRLPDTESITAEELSELARKYLGRDRVSRAAILPTPQKAQIPMARPDGT
jgi:zinc protease